MQQTTTSALMLPHPGTSASVRHDFAPKYTSAQKGQAKNALPLAPDYTLPTIGRVTDLYRLENLGAGQTKRKDCLKNGDSLFSI